MYNNKEDELLWYINNMREHDGLKPFAKYEDLVNAVKDDIEFIPIE